MTIYDVTDARFRKYGRIVTGIDFTQLLDAMEETPKPESVVYEPSVPQLEALPVYQALADIAYGEMPIQIGYCNGDNHKLNALEYHRSSEVDVAATDLILLLGSLQDVSEKYTYDTSLVEAFRVPAGTAVELYATTLHFAPCTAVEGGFRCVIVLPKDTNLPLDKKHENRAGQEGLGEDSLITARNKWLIGHAEGGLLQGCHIGLQGENLTV